MSSAKILQRLVRTSCHLDRIAQILNQEGVHQSGRCARAARFPKSHYKPLVWQSQARRGLTTATENVEFKPYALDSVTPPPRNTNIPDSSITDPPITLDGSKADSSPSDSSRNISTAEIATNVSVTESEAQISRAVPNKTVSPERKSRLRPRKAVMQLSTSAVSQLRLLLSQPEPKLIRVGVKNRGCSGLAYNLEYVDKAGTFDETVEQDGVKVLVDSKALFSIIGSEMDWVSEKLGERFVFRNPNIRTMRLRRELHGIVTDKPEPALPFASTQGFQLNSQHHIDFGLSIGLHLTGRLDDMIAQLHYALGKIYRANIFNNTSISPPFLQSIHKLDMCGIFLEIVHEIGFFGESHHEAVRVVK